MVLAAGATLACGQVRAQGHMSHAALEVQAVVKPSVVLQLDQRAVRVTVSESDIARGYVDVSENALLSVNAGFLKPVLVVDFSPTGSVFTSVEIMTTDLRSAAQRLRGLDWLNDLRGTKGFSSLDEALRYTGAEQSGTMALIGYRFRLAAGVRPGSYPVPMTVNVGL
jgi:hypothetical protein